LLKLDISSFKLHIIAMFLMAIDHIGLAIFDNNIVLRSIGRLAYPIFAFMIVEGFLKTKNRIKYFQRLFLLAILSEIPFDLLISNTPFQPYSQNVLFTFCIALLFMVFLEKIKQWGYYNLFFGLIIFIISGFVSILLFLDYGVIAIPMVLVFYFFKDRTCENLVFQFFTILFLSLVSNGRYFSFLQHGIPVQVFALFALIPIWFYNGTLGYHSKAYRIFCYLFYPAHISLILLYKQYICNIY